MDKSPRDTQFQGFAKALIKDLDAVMVTTYASLDKARQAYELAIARRAYDLVLHTVEHVDMIDLARLFRQEIAERIPDLTELPKEQD